MNVLNKGSCNSLPGENLPSIGFTCLDGLSLHMNRLVMTVTVHWTANRNDEKKPPLPYPKNYQKYGTTMKLAVQRY